MKDQVKPRVNMAQLREALETSWDAKTSYLGVVEAGNPALGQCYPTARIVQFYFPESEIVEGQVWTGKSLEKHFWNILIINGEEFHIDFTWRQFPVGSSVQNYAVRDRNTLGDGQQTLRRVALLKARVADYLAATAA